jgi:acyl-CoA thioesterase FadM
LFPWFRLFRTSLTLIGAPRLDPLATTRVALRVWPNDLDFNMHVNNGRYLALADISRVHWFLRTGVLQSARRERAIPIVGDVIAKFRRDLKLFQQFHIETRMLGWDHRWGFLEHRFIREGRVLGVVAIRGVFKGPNGPIEPGTLLSALGISATSPALPLWVDEWNDGCDSLSHVLREEEQARDLR